MIIDKRKIYTLKEPDFIECEDVFSFTSSFKIQNLTIPAPYENQVYYHLDLMPLVNCDSLDKCIEENAVFASKIKYLNEKQYEEVFGNKNPAEIVGKLIQLTFAIPGKWWKGGEDHSHKITRLEKREFYSPEFKVDETPLSIIRIEPKCCFGHIAPITFGRAHYYLTAVSKGKTDFDLLKDFLQFQRGEYSGEERGYPKKHLPLELREFNFLA